MIREQHMPLVEQRAPRIERGAPSNREGDYRAVISQIKQEILVEISGRPNQTSPTLHSVPDAKLKSLLEQVQREASRRGLAENYYGKPEPLGGVNVFQMLLAVLLFPSARKKLERILAQTALGGLELLEKAKDNIAIMMRDELF